MPITIIKDLQAPKKVFAHEFTDGCAYMDEQGTIFIANRYRDIAGMSICGTSIAFKDAMEDCQTLYTPVNLSVTVTYY